MIEHTLLRFSGQGESTLGVWLDSDRRFLTYTLEDEHRNTKVPGETCIPAGRYPLKKWTHADSRFRQRAAELFPDMDRGYVVEIGDVPDFEATLVHWGNTDLDTRGCVLVGETSEQNVTERGRIGASRTAYQRWYPVVADDIDSGEEVWLVVIDYDDPFVHPDPPEPVVSPATP